MAQFSGLTLNTVGTGYTISATNGTLTSVPSNPINVTPSTATTLVVSIPPPTTMTSGSQFGLAIAVLDAYGNLATGYTGVVTIALENNPGNASLGGPLTATPVGGIANFHAFITTETAASGYTLQATADGLTPVTTGPITVIPAAGDAPGRDHTTALARHAGQHVRVCRRRRRRLRQHRHRLYRHDLRGGAERIGRDLGRDHDGHAHITVEATFSGLTLTETNGGVALTVTSTGLASATTNVVSVTTPAQLAFAVSTVTVNPGAGAASIEVMRTGGLHGSDLGYRGDVERHGDRRRQLHAGQPGLELCRRAEQPDGHDSDQYGPARRRT